jgi:hypothetical protein
MCMPVHVHVSTGSPAGAAGRRIASLGLSSPESAVLRLYASELDAERLWEVMSAMGLHDKVGGVCVCESGQWAVYVM